MKNETTTPFELNLPKFKQAKIELWKFLSPNDIEQLLKCFENLEQVAQNRDYELCKITFANKLKLNPKVANDSIQLDQYYYLIKFCVQQNFNQEKCSALIYIANSLHELMKSTSYGNIDQCYDYLKQLILRFSVYRPPFSLQVFQPQQAKCVLDYFVNTYLKHFKLYKLVFTPAIKLDLKFQYSNAEYERQLDEEEGQQQEGVQAVEVQQQEEQEQQHECDDKNLDLKRFIKDYLTKKIDKVKESIEIEIKEQEIEINKKLSQTATPQTPKKGAKKGK